MKSSLSSIIIFVLIFMSSATIGNKGSAESKLATIGYVMDIIDEFKAMSVKYDLDYNFSEPEWWSNEKITTIKGIYSFDVYRKDYVGAAAVSFVCEESGNVFKTFIIDFYNDDNMELYVDLIALIITALNRDIGIVESKAKAEYLLSTRSYDDYSDTLQISDYMLTLDYIDPSGFSLWVTHQSDMKMPTDTSAYVGHSYEDLKSNNHNNEKIVIRGMLEGQENKRSTSGALMKYIYFSSSHNKYTGVFHYAGLPIPLENGKEYTFFGIIIPPDDDDVPLIRIEYIDEVH